MARYAQLYAEVSDKLVTTERALAKAEFDRDTYRTFIKETGLLTKFLVWWARKQGFPEAAIEEIAAIQIDTDYDPSRDM